MGAHPVKPRLPQDGAPADAGDTVELGQPHDSSTPTTCAKNNNTSCEHHVLEPQSSSHGHSVTPSGLHLYEPRCSTDYPVSGDLCAPAGNAIERHDAIPREHAVHGQGVRPPLGDVTSLDTGEPVLLARLHELRDSVQRRHGSEILEVNLGLTGVTIFPTPQHSTQPPTHMIRPVSTHHSPAHQLSLEVAMRVWYPLNQFTTLKVLVDTGAQVSLINRKLVPPECWCADVQPVKFRAANQQTLPGGDLGVHVHLQMKARTEHGASYAVAFPALLYGAQIQADVILSYSWLSEHGMAVVPLEHAMVWLTGPELMWVDAYETTHGTPPRASTWQV